jgi:hypothetical protein
VGACVRDAHRIAGLDTSRGVVDHLVRWGGALQNLDLGAVIGPERHFLEHDFIVGGDGRHSQAILAKQQGAGRDLQDVGISCELEIDIGVSAGLKEPVRVLRKKLDEQGPRTHVDGARGRRDSCLERPTRTSENKNCINSMNLITIL